MSNSLPVSALVEPEFNTTLKLAGCLQQLQDAEADASQLADERLKNCPEVAEAARDKTSKCLNYDLREQQFCSLVPIDINESLLIEQIETRRARPRRVRPPALGAPQPQLSDLIHLSTQYEFPAPPPSQQLTDEGPQPPPPRPLGLTESVRRALRQQTHLHLRDTHRRRL